MPGQFWVAPIDGPPVGAAGTPLNTSTTLTDIQPVPKILVPAYFFDHVGASVRFTAKGVFSNTATPTLLLGIYYDGVTTALAATAATTTTTGATNWHWGIEATGIVRATGTAGSMLVAGRAYLGTSATALTTIPIPNATMAATTIDTTVSKVYGVGAQWGTSSSSNTITCHQYIVESIG